ncbi:MAG: radical SAM protein [Candidatus Korarchaeota archaeon]|nr:radical SAM protein [Candidatus Korarchaeota archaeon]NIU84570.1 radical SAM protein [Candidatus Thorarchaeota archaeon]NIW14628.1 radical SAM protein [Candidatus Thorarchaeota archaeon]NIW52705.1 radical SAM protein [Candidatus Korarchaeota archaeon]
MWATEKREGDPPKQSNNPTGDFHTYKDPIPTNCCANWFCLGGTGRGYPEFANTPNTEYGYHNLAVFFYGCNFDCFFCQNINHKRLSDRYVTRATEVVERVLRNKKYSCVCYFGGSPEPHFPFVLNLNRQILEKKEKDRVLRICFEWNGAGNPSLVKKAAQQALENGGIVKFDLKAPDSKMSYALSGVTNERVFSNFQLVYENFWEERPNVPVLTATTLLVPGYIGPEEIERISKRIASIDERIPYSLLVFHPDFKALDLPITPKEVANSSLKKAKKHLKYVHLGNKHLLSLAPSK